MHILRAPHLSETFENLRTPAVISSVLVLPFMILELVNRRHIYTGFPVVLFAFMWLLAFSFIIILMPMLRSLPTGHRIVATTINLLSRIVVLILIALMWVGVVLDQMPCFLGIPNCD